MNRNIFPNPIFMILSSIFGIYFVFYVSKIIDNKIDKITSVLIYIGQNTLPIMAFHFFSFKIVMLVQLYFGLITFNQLAILTGANNNNLWYIAYVIAGIGIPILINHIIQKVKLKLTSCL